MSRDVHSCTHCLRPRYSPLPPAFGGRALLVSKDRRHLFVTPWLVQNIFTVHDVIEKKSPMASHANVLCHGKVLNVIARCSWLYFRHL
jgi:hypothetical protein